MDPAYADTLCFLTGELQPGVRYRVIKPFDDESGIFHQLGEEWIFLGHESRKLSATHSLFVRDLNGTEIKIVLSGRRLPSDPPTTFDNLSLHVAGPVIPSQTLISMLAPDVQQAFGRQKRLFEPLPPSGSDLVKLAQSLYGRAKSSYTEGWGASEKDVADLSLLIKAFRQAHVEIQ